MNIRKNTVWLALVFVALSAVAAGAWEPAKGPLMTRWAKDVAPDRVWAEYPRPQMVRENWVNLNGLWSYAIRPQTDKTPADWDGEILVPFPVESALSGVMQPVKPDQQLWYRRSFTAPKSSTDQRLLLHFGAVDWKCTVFVNGKEIGQHTGGYDPFNFDITDAVKQGDNELVVAVADPSDTGNQPRGKQVLQPRGIMYTAVTGVWQTVWLEPVPEYRMASLKIVPDVDGGTVSVGASAVGGEGGTLRIKAICDDKTVSEAEGPVGEAVHLAVPNAVLWSPDRPHLYDLAVELVVDGKTVDTLSSYFGMRKIEVKKDKQGIHRLWLNNEVLFQYGPLDQGWWPDGLYTPATDAALKYDVEMTKKLGMNMARKHVKYECPRWYYWCDRLGLLVWQDMPSGRTARSEESRANFRRELKAMIDTLANHPSIVMWIPFNEGWGQHATPEVVAWIKEYEPTRPVNEASGWHDRGSGDVSDMHSYPGPGMRAPEETRVSVLGEFGGLGMPVRGHTWQEEENWGYVSYNNKEQLTDAYVNLLTEMRPLIGRGLSAAVYTQTTDVEIEVNGLMTYDRELVKMDEELIVEAARKLYQPAPKVQTVVVTSEQTPQQWRYTTAEPPADWKGSDFDDSGWKGGEGGFGTVGTPGAVVRTVWDGTDIWLRRSFDLDSLPENGELLLYAHHDDDAEVYLNGELVRRIKGFTQGYKPFAIGGEAKRLLLVGKNTLAVHCRQNMGGQYIDVGLVELVER